MWAGCSQRLGTCPAGQEPGRAAAQSPALCSLCASSPGCACVGAGWHWAFGQVGKGNLTHAAWMGALEGGLKQVRKYLEKVTQTFPALHAFLPPLEVSCKIWDVADLARPRNQYCYLFWHMGNVNQELCTFTQLQYDPYWWLPRQRSEPYLIWKLFWFDICKQFYLFRISSIACCELVLYFS